MRDDDDAKEVFHRLLENLGNASGVLNDLSTYLEYFEARAQRVIKGLLRGAGIIVVGFLVAVFLTANEANRANNEANNAKHAVAEVKAVSVKNRLAIRVGCTLLSNAIIESGAGPKRTSPRAQALLTEKLIMQIMSTMTEKERAEVVKLQQKSEKEGDRLTVPDCDEIARHPESVKAIPLAPK